MYLGMFAIAFFSLLLAGDGRYTAALVCFGYGVVSTALLVLLFRAPKDEQMG